MNHAGHNTHARFSINYQPWMSKVREGDVLRAGSGQLRVVRYVCQYGRGPKKGLLKSVTFTIQHCSWTGRCSTTLTYTDLFQRGFQPTGVRKTLRSKLDKLIALDTGQLHQRNLSCCDVEGIA